MSDELTGLRQALAELCHEQWSGWMKHLFSKCEILPNGDKGEIAVIPEWAVQRWTRQMETPYKELSDHEKDSDLKEADRFLAILKSREADTKPLVRRMIETMRIPEDFSTVNAALNSLAQKLDGSVTIHVRPDGHPQGEG